MEGRGIETLLSYHCLTDAAVFSHNYDVCFHYLFLFLKLYDVAGPLVNNHDSSFNKFRVKFRTYIVEYDVEDVRMILSDMFFFSSGLMLLSVMILIVFVVESGSYYVM